MKPVIRWFYLLAAVTLSACGAAGDRGDTTAAESPAPLVVVGVDAATWDVIDPMIAAGDLPTFRRLTERGARADLIAIPPLSSPVVWTTFVTGRFGRHHNILDHTVPYGGGAKRPVDSTWRRSPALWNVAGRHSKRVAVIGYYASHPPEVVNGVMVSSRAAEGVGGGSYPPERSELVDREFERVTSAEGARAIRARYFPWPFDLKALNRPEDPYHRVTQVVKGRVDRQIRYEEFYRGVAMALAPEKFDLFMLYLRMPDHATHATWLYHDDTGFDEKPDARDKELLGGVVETAYRRADEILGELLASVGEEVNVVVLSDHGSGSATGRWAIRQEALQHLTGNHRPDGIFLAAGPDVRPGVIEGLTSLDVAPTLAALMALPVSRQMPGRVVTEALAPGFLERFPIRHVTAYRVRWQVSEEAEAPSASAELEQLETLKALGYLGGEATLSESSGEEELDFWSIEPRLRHRELIGEVLFHLMREDPDAVDRVVQLVAQNDPALARGLARIVLRDLSLWQTSFSFELVPESARRAFAERYDGG